MGCVATSEARAVAVGVEVLRGGGSAVDAGVAMVACLTVTEPTSNGLGGDLFALVAEAGGESGRDGRITALQANGASPAGLDVEAIRRQARAGGVAGRMPLYGWAPVTVPGQVSGWAALHERYGRLPWARLLQPAIDAARDGFEVGPITAAAWARAQQVYAAVDDPLMASWADVFTVDGRTPRAGETFCNPALARSLSAIAAGGATAFYTDLGERIAAWSSETGGWLTPEDFRSHIARWVEPWSVTSRGWTVWGMSAPTQGIAALQALGMLEHIDGSPGTPLGEHVAIEAIKRAFADTYATVCDGAGADALDPAYLASRAVGIDGRAGPSPASPGIAGGTVLAVAVDDAGQAISIIQSNFHGFGSGLVVPGTGIALQNRGAGFVLAPDEASHPCHPNALAAGKRPFHTILPGLLRPPGTDRIGPFGCMGGQMQPQGHVQLVRALQASIDAQRAVDRPRWRWLDTGEVALEVGHRGAESLSNRGHTVQPGVASTHFGGAQLIVPTSDGGWDAGSDPRKDGDVGWTS